jgi:hypothetical protein
MQHKIVPRNKAHCCLNCRYVGNIKKSNKSNDWVLLILLLFFIVPGLIYLLWSILNWGHRCPLCKSWNVVTPVSPMGNLIYKEYEAAYSQAVAS